MTAFLVLLLLLIAPRAWAVPSFDAATEASAEFVDNISFSHAVGGGCAETFIATTLGWYSSSQTVSAHTIGGSAATLVIAGDALSSRAISMYRRVGVSTGSNTIAATWTGSLDVITAISVSYCGVHQTVPTGTAVKASVGAGSGDPTVDAASATDEVVIDGVLVVENALQEITAGAGQTDRGNLHATQAGYFVHGSSSETGAATTTMSWTLVNDTGGTIVAVPIKPATAPAASGGRRRLTQGTLSE